MSSESTTRSDIYAIVNVVTGVGMVHDYERWANDWSTFLDRFKTTISGSTLIRGWTITCSAWIQDHAMRVYTYKIRGYFGLDDSAASEKIALGIVEAVAKALNTSNKFDNFEVCQLDVFEPRLFGSVLCHYAELTFKVAVGEVF